MANSGAAKGLPKENGATNGETKDKPPDATAEGDTKFQENASPEGEAKREHSNADASGKQVKRKKTGAKSYEHLLDETPMKFKNISFESVKTPEEKAAKKAAKKAEKKGKKKEPKASSADEKVKSTEEAPPKHISSKEKQESAKPASSEGSLEKKTKKKVAAKEVKEEDTKKEPKKKGKKETKDSDSEKSQEEGAGKKTKKGKKPSTDESPEKTEKTKKPKEPKQPKDDVGEKKDKKQKAGKKKGDLQEITSTGSPEPKDFEDEDETGSIDADGEDKARKRSKKPFKSVSFTTSMMQKGLPKSSSGPLDSDSIERSKTSVKSKDSGASEQSEFSEDSRLELFDSSEDFGPRISKSKAKGQKARRSRGKIKTKSSLSTVDELSDDSEDTLKQLQKVKEKKEKKAKKRGPKSEIDVSTVDLSPKPSKEIKEEQKEKKKKGKKKAETEAPVQEVDSVMEQIQKMKAAAEVKAAPTTLTAEEQPTKTVGKKGKKGKKEKALTEPQPRVKKMSEAERLRMEAEKVEQARIQAELDAKNAEEEERKRQEEERKQGREKEKREFAEQQLRVEQLGNSLNLIKNMLDANWNTNTQEKIDVEWDQYLKCDGLPDPTKPAEINTYLHLWEQALKDVSVEEVTRRTNEIIALLDVLQGFIDDPFDAPNSLVADWKWVRNLCRKHQQENLDMATYRLLRDIDSRLNRIDIPTADFHIHEDNFNLSLWLYVQLATPMYNPRAPVRKRLEIEFSKSFTVLFPSELDAKCMAIRTIYLKYDHLSDSCASYDRPSLPSEINQDLYEAVAEEWYQKMWYKWEHRKPPPKKMAEDSQGNLIEIVEPEPVIEKDELPPPVPWQKLDITASKYGADAETELYEEIHNKLCIEVPDKVLNLRKFLVIGGIYCINLFYQPPQPHDLVAFDIRITALQIPKKLCLVPFYVAPERSTDSEAKRPPEELEEEAKRQEAELDKLMLVTLILPDHVMFLDLPVVCHWHKKRKVWSTADVYDVKHIEEKSYMTFRTGRFGHFALAVNRYLNFPFQAWELRPETDGSVTFQITCAILMVEFKLKDNRICLTQLQNSPNNALQDIVGIYYKLPKLIRILQTGGVDLFPACDAFCYIEGACEKHWPTERHLYYCMALLSPSYNFAWSRWNNQAGRRNIVVQMREYKLNSTKQKTHSMLLVTPLKATFIETTEVSPVFNDTPTEGMKFYADLYHLMKGTSTMATRNKVLNGSPDVAKTLSDLLLVTRVASFS